MVKFLRISHHEVHRKFKEPDVFQSLLTNSFVQQGRHVSQRDARRRQGWGRGGMGAVLGGEPYDSLSLHMVTLVHFFLEGDWDSGAASRAQKGLSPFFISSSCGSKQLGFLKRCPQFIVYLCRKSLNAYSSHVGKWKFISPKLLNASIAHMLRKLAEAEQKLRRERRMVERWEDTHFPRIVGGNWIVTNTLVENHSVFPTTIPKKSSNYQEREEKDGIGYKLISKENKANYQPVSSRWNVYAIPLFFWVTVQSVY